MSIHSKIASNALITYARFIVSAGLSLFSSRLVLSALGQSDYGLFSLVGALIVFVTALNSLMANSAARYFAFSAGERGASEVNAWFNAALGIHLLMATSLVLIGWPVGEYLILNTLNVPADRLDTCVAVFRISLLSGFFSMVSVPYVAIFTAKQRFGNLAFWGVMQAFLSFALAWLLTYSSGDRLIFYAKGVVLIAIVINGAQVFQAMKSFEECQFSFKKIFNKDKIKNIFAFSSWNLFGWSGVLLRDQGSALLLNVYFGPSANAAYAIAAQVSNQTNQFSSSLLSAFSPAINTYAGAGDRGKVISLSQSASLYGVALTLLVTIPLMIEMEAILDLWLGVVPEHAAVFCRLILATFIIDRLSSGYMLAVQATGKIAAYQATVGLSLLCTLPIAWLLLRFGYPPSGVGAASVLTMCVTSFGRVLWGKYLFQIPVKVWVSSVFIPSAVMVAAGLLAGLLVHICFQPGLTRAVMSVSWSIVTSLLAMWLVVLSKNERQAVKTRLFGQ